MAISSYAVEIGKAFNAPVYGLAPANYDPDKHDVFYPQGEEAIIKPSWCPTWQYRIEPKKVVKRRFTAISRIGSGQVMATLETAWAFRWASGSTKFVVEKVYEDHNIIDMIVHKDPISE